MVSFSLFSAITKPTRVCDQSATLIDHIWTTKLDTNSGNYIIETDITDNFPLFSQSHNHIDNPKLKFINKRLIASTATEKFANELDLQNWSNVL